MARYSSSYDDETVAGTVTSRSQTLHFVDVRVETWPNSQTAVGDEYVVTLNGRPLRRLSTWDAERFGIIEKR
jgi:hypothetical protein